MLTAVLIAVIAAPSPRQPFPLDEPDDREAREEEEEIELERIERAERWRSMDTFEWVLRTGVRGGFNVPDGEPLVEDGSVELSFGFTQRLPPRYALQANVAFGTGFGRRTDERFGPLFDASTDVTLRIGSARVYFGIGPIARFWHVFGDAESLRIGGGVVAELGVLFGDEREIDLGLRAHGGGFRREGKFDVWVSESLAFGWHF